MSQKKILIAGGTGLIGNRIRELLPIEKYHINILTRNKKPSSGNTTYYEWDIKNKIIPPEACEVDYIINLTGAGIAESRWTEKRKDILIKSRTESISLITHTLRKIDHRPEAVVCASAIGYYGDRGSEILDESSDSGKGFLPHCCQLWEEASNHLVAESIRGSIIRIGIVLSTKGGALPKILLTSKAGLLNYFGDGQQYYSFIHIDDLCRLMIKSLENNLYNGIINGVAPIPLPNKIFTQQIAETLDGFHITLPVPAFALKLALGEMAHVVLDSAKVIPRKLEELNFTWKYPGVADIVRDLQENKI